MLKKFALWFIVFGLSFLVSDVFGWTEQDKAFLYIHIGISVILILVLIATVIAAELAGASGGEAAKVMLASMAYIFFCLIATWGVSKLFNLDFYVAYEIMTFCQCLSLKEKLKKTIEQS